MSWALIIFLIIFILVCSFGNCLRVLITVLHFVRFTLSGVVFDFHYPSISFSLFHKMTLLRNILSFYPLFSLKKSVHLFRRLLLLRIGD